ncbi:MAG: arsenate reductase [Candidatus Krumholzibacteriia bacterium]
MRILFVCTANSCRSQMAEAWARQMAPASWDIHSAGLLTFRITAKTRAVMEEVGLDMKGQKPQIIDKVDLNSFDRVVTLSQEAGQYLPTLVHPDRHLHLPVTDPMSFKGDSEETRADFRRGRDEIRDIVATLIDGK